MNRKQRRAAQKEMGQDATEKLSQKFSQFEQLPEMCLTCEKSFDKTDRAMVESWTVIVREKDGSTVRLYCPDCWGKAQDIVKIYIQQEEEDESSTIK